MARKPMTLRDWENHIRRLIKKGDFDSRVEAREIADEFIKSSKYVKRLYPWNLR